MSGPRVSVVVVSYNSARYLRRCLDALLTQEHPSFEVILVDNGSTDGSLDSVDPRVRVVRTPANLHYTGGNNLGFREARGELLASVNVDTEVEPGWLAALEAALDSDPGTGLATSKVLLDGDRDRVNACGNLVHISGLGFCRGLGEPASRRSSDEDVPSISGAAFMTRRAVIDQVGGFDESFYAYVEDTDLSLRVRLAGYRVVMVAGSVVHHDYELRMRPEKFRYLERNRQLPFRKVFKERTLRLLWPALRLADLMTFASAALGGPEYLAARRTARAEARQMVRELSAARAQAQATRRVTDRELLRHVSAAIPAGQLGVPGPLAAVVAPLAAAAFWLAMLPARLLTR